MTVLGCKARFTLLRGAELVAAPWKNGGGVTREIAAFSAEERDARGAGLDRFVWRVSVADVGQAGPFSRFEGIDRTLVLLSGAGMLLDEAPAVASANDAQRVKTHTLTQALDMARFAGEARIDARLVDGATRDFNLMVRRDAAQGELEVWRADRQQDTQRIVSGDVALLYCASGAVSVTPADAQPVSLEAGDTLRIDTPNALHCTVQGAGALLAITIRYTQR
ncbi:HutD family protein [Paraburkholderia sp. BCC1884]|uniref:HutD/Ves family protein n=1 Tax=Paraburkholderia sp. BCC1884 TaxID=2562668 RepID=UPI00118214F2|nr:HutD family protein [Paraburkholderia sp. BCC1884]